jgi:hypothetical protein
MSRLYPSNPVRSFYPLHGDAGAVGIIRPFEGQRDCRTWRNEPRNASMSFPRCEECRCGQSDNADGIPDARQSRPMAARTADQRPARDRRLQDRRAQAAFSEPHALAAIGGGASCPRPGSPPSSTASAMCWAPAPRPSRNCSRARTESQNRPGWLDGPLGVHALGRARAHPDPM